MKTTALVSRSWSFWAVIITVQSVVRDIFPVFTNWKTTAYNSSTPTFFRRSDETTVAFLLGRAKRATTIGKGAKATW